MPKSIAMVLPFFGNLNKSGYFNMFLTSCKFNKDITFLIITDDKEKYDYPENVRIIYMDFDALRKRINDCFDFFCYIPKPYKLCDYKVAYGEIFKKELEEFDFWGYMDCDLIFGDIRKFVRDELLVKYRKLYSRGHFTLYRNDAATTGMYKFVIEDSDYCDYKKIFSSKFFFNFEEWGNHLDRVGPLGSINRIFMKNNIPFYNELDFDDISMKRSCFFPEQRVKNAPHNNMKNIAYSFNKGKLIRCSEFYGELNKEEILYVHFQKRVLSCNIENTDKFLIFPDFFCDYKEITIEDLRKIKKDRLRLEYYKMKLDRFLKVRILKKPGF